MPLNKEDLSFKKLISKEFTNPSRQFFQEVTTATLDISSTDIYSNVISSSTASAILDGYAKQYTLFTLTPDPTYPTTAWYFCSGSGFTPGTSTYDATKVQRNFISDKYGTEYEVKLYDNSNNQIFKTDAINWYFDYKTGILAVADPGAYTTPYKVSVIQYIGDTLNTTLTDLSSSIGGGSGFPFSGSAVITGSLLISGSGTIDELVVSGNVIATQGFAGSLLGDVFGTASWATNAVNATSALTASYVNPLTQSVFISGGIDIYLSNSWDIYTGQYIIGNGDVPLAPIAITGSGLIISASDLPTSVYNFLKIGNTEIVNVDNTFAGNSLLIHNVDSFQVTSGSDGGIIKTLFYHNGDTFNIYTGGSSSPLASFSTSSVTISPTNGTSLTTPVSINAEYLESFQYGVAVFETDDNSNPSVIRRASNSKFIFTTGSTSGQIISGSGNIHALRILGGSGSISALIVTGGLSVDGGITGSLLGTASWANNVISASHGVTASYVNTLNQNVSINGTLTVSNTTTLNGDLLVYGSASFFGSSSFINVQNLAIEDKFILLNSGSKGTPSHEGGIIIQTSASANNVFGTAIFYDQEANRWMVARSSSVAANATSITVGATTDYIVTVSASAGAPTSPPVNFGTGNSDYSIGQMYINTTDHDIYIYA
jgi:hypothetical protein